jgi:hypothetical protein
MVYDPATDVSMVWFFNIWDVSTGSLSTPEVQLLATMATDAKHALGY